MGIWVSDSGLHGNLMVFGDISWMMVVIRAIKWDTRKDNLGLVEIEWDFFLPTTQSGISLMETNIAPPKNHRQTGHLRIGSVAFGNEVCQCFKMVGLRCLSCGCV